MMPKSNAIVRSALTKGTRDMNSHKANMYVGAAIGSLLLFLLLGFVSNLIYVGSGHAEHETLAFAVPVEDAAAGGGEDAAVDWAALVQAADPANGEKAFGKCKACHQVVEGANGVGPYLWGVVGRKIATAEGYSFSDALTAMDGDWDLENLSKFIENPKAYAPGTKMNFGGIKKIEDRVDLIAYLNQTDGTPVDLVPAGSAAAAPAPTETAAQPAATEAPAPAAEPAADPAPATEPAPQATTEAPAAPAGGYDFASLLASADAAAGEKSFRKCKACHKVEEGKNGVGPSLWGVVGRPVGSVEGFNYSDAMKSHGGNWTGTNLFGYLADPKGFIPGNKMAFPGIKDAQERVNVIVYLNEADGTPEPLE
jgi:cytochrome c2